MGLLRQLTKWMLTASLPRTRWFVRGSARAAGGASRFAGEWAAAAAADGSSTRLVSLTFDDGPHSEHTPRVLDRLAELDWRATFFVIGAAAERHPQLIQRIAAAGHTLGNHTWSHHEPRATSTADFLEEVDRTDALLRELTGQTPRLMRPPKGELTWSKIRGLWQRNKTIALWSSDPKDYRLTAREQATAVGQSLLEHWTTGEIILLHDNRPAASWFLDCWQTLPAVATVRSLPMDQWLPSRSIVTATALTDPVPAALSPR